jgi:hypothetical protein
MQELSRHGPSVEHTAQAEAGPRTAEPNARRDTTLLAGAVTVALISSWLLHAASFRGLHADGAYYFLNIIGAGDFFHPSETRVSVTYLNQLPLLLALRAGFESGPALLALYTASLVGLPILAYLLAAWIARGDRLLSVANLVLVVAAFYPTSFEMIGEYHVLYAWSWLAFVLLVSGRADTLLGAAPLPAIGLAVMKSYELSLILCPLLAALCIWRIVRAEDAAARAVLLATAYLLAWGAWFGLAGGVLRTDGAAGSFAQALGRLPENEVLLQLWALTLLAAGAAFLPHRGLQWGFAIALLMGFAGFAYRQIQPSEELGLGVPNDQRAQVPVILLAVGALYLATRFMPIGAALARPLAVPILLLPLLTAFTVDMVETRDWRAYLDEVCAELRLADEATDEAEFFARRRIVKMRYDWEYPALSILLRPSGSERILQNPAYTDWLPYASGIEAPDVRRFGTGEGVCR